MRLRSFWWVAVGHLQCAMSGWRHLQTASPWSVLSALKSLLEGGRGCKVCRRFWCGGRRHRLTAWRHGTVAGRKRRRKVLEQEHTPVSLRSWLGRVPMRIRRYCTVPFMSSWKDVIILKSLGVIQSSEKGWRGLVGWPSQKPRSGQWRRCTAVLSALDTSPVVALGRRSCRWLIFQL